MLTIHLKNLLFFGYHGLYPEERILGNDFKLDIDIDFLPTSNPVLHIDQTVNYVTIYDLAKRRMSLPANLLETIAMQIAEDIQQLYPEVCAIAISLYKQTPPIETLNGSVGVTYKWNRE